MRFRFLYLNEAGEEVEVGGLDELRSCVAMGRVDENTLLYDAVTREWAPARAHSAFRTIVAEEGDDLMGPPGESDFSLEPDREPPSEDDGDLPELTPLLEPDFDPVNAFLEKQERERRMDSDAPLTSGLSHLHVVEPGDELADRSADPVPEPPRPERRPPDPAPPPTMDEDEPEEEESPEVEVVVPEIRSTAPPRPIRRSPVGRRRRQLVAVAGVALVMVATWAIFLRDGAEAGDLPAVVIDGDPPPPAEGGELADRLDEARGSAFGDMVLAMDSVRRAFDLQGGPDGWLDGHYLATASEYPGVQEYWQRYLRFVDELRARDTVFFRMGFMERIRDEGLEGPVVSMRLASALSDFRASQPTRDVLYTGMEELARRALALHELLVRRESDVEYDPVQLGTVSRDPVMEAFPRQPELREQIYAHLDSLFEAMEVVQGGVPGSRDQLGDAALRAILETGGREDGGAGGG